MSIGGGRDRAELLPYNPKTYTDSDDPNKLMGCHKGLYAGLNIHNPQPKRYYAWGNDDQRSLLLMRQQGYQVVREEEPERAAYAEMLGHEHQETDSSSSGFPGVVLLARSEQDERKVRSEEQSRRDQLLRGGDTEARFRQKASAEEIQMGGQRLLGKDHRTHVTSGQPEDEVQDSWTPDRGIFK